MLAMVGLLLALDRLASPSPVAETVRAADATTAEASLELAPGSAEAYNNIAAAYNSMERWDDGIQAAKEATRLKPDFELARNNLLYALGQKQRSESAQIASKQP